MPLPCVAKKKEEFCVEIPEIRIARSLRLFEKERQPAAQRANQWALICQCLTLQTVQRCAASRDEIDFQS